MYLSNSYPVPMMPPTSTVAPYPRREAYEVVPDPGLLFCRKHVVLFICHQPLSTTSCNRDRNKSHVLMPGGGSESRVVSAHLPDASTRTMTVIDPVLAAHPNSGCVPRI